MPNTALAKAREFHHRYLKLSEASGYALVYDSLKLMLDYIPGTNIGMDVLKAGNEDPDDITQGSMVLSIGTPMFTRTVDAFYRLLPYLPFASRTGKRLKRQILAGESIIALGYDDDEHAASGIIHEFYSKVFQASDMITSAGRLACYQVLALPNSRGFYTGFSSIGRANGETFTHEEKQLFALFFDIVFEDFKRKINTSEECGFLPYLVLNTFKPRELASIKACFDLKQAGQLVTRLHLAQYLHLANRSDSSAAELKKALDKVDYDLKKIKYLVFKDFADSQDEQVLALQERYDWHHVVEMFKIYAYFGFYPDPSKRLVSYLQTKMGAWATE